MKEKQGDVSLPTTMRNVTYQIHQLSGLASQWQKSSIKTIEQGTLHLLFHKCNGQHILNLPVKTVLNVHPD